MKNGWILISVVAMLVGCAGQKPVQQPVCFEAIGKDKLMASAEKVLTSMQFTIEKLDEENGVIRTRPLRGGQFFEPWRKDNASASAAAESNLQSLQRTVELTFSSDASTMCMSCTATVKRLSLPDEPIQGYLGAPAIHTDSDHSTQRLDVDKDRLDKMRWIDLGRDEAMENKILTQIQAKIAKGMK